MQTTRVLQSKHNACQLNKQQPFNAQAFPFHQKENFSRLDANTPTLMLLKISPRSGCEAHVQSPRPEHEK
jgi:hypothetical protein